MVGLLAPKPKAAPPPPPPAVIPDVDDAAVKEAKKKSIAKQAARAGSRESTFLTSPFGGGETKMGG